MNKFLMGLFAGYLTMTSNGQKITKKITDGFKDDVTNYLKKEGVIEPDKTTRPSKPVESSDKPEKQCSTDESVDE